MAANKKKPAQFDVAVQKLQFALNQWESLGGCSQHASNATQERLEEKSELFHKLKQQIKELSLDNQETIKSVMTENDK